MTVEDVDFDRGIVTIKHLKARLKLFCTGCGQRLGKSHMFCPKCGSKIEKTRAEQEECRRQRVLPVDSDTQGMLKEYVRRGGPVLQDGKKLLFGINRHRAWQVVTECAEKAALPKLVNSETGKIHNARVIICRECHVNSRVHPYRSNIPAAVYPCRIFVRHQSLSFLRCPS